MSDFDCLLRTADIPVPERTLRHWTHEGRGTAAEEKHTSGAGRLRALADSQVQILVGHVLEKNKRGEVVTLHTVLSFVQESFGVKLSATIARKYLSESYLTSRVSQRVAPITSIGMCGLAKICSD